MTNYSRKSRWFTNHANVNACFTNHEKIESMFPEDGKILIHESRKKINPHSRFTQSKNGHSLVTKKYRGVSKIVPVFFGRPRSSVGRVTVHLIRRSWVRFPPRSQHFFFTSCGSLIPFTRANAQWALQS